MRNPFRWRDGGSVPAEAMRSSVVEAGHDSLQRIWQDAKGEAQRVLAGVIEAQTKAGTIPGQQDEQQWFELADQRLGNAIENLERARARRRETPDLHTDTLAELQRVQGEIKTRLVSSNRAAA